MFKEVVNKLLQGDITCLTREVVEDMNEFTVDTVKHNMNPNNETLDNIFDVVYISNILYNNTDRTMLPLDDGVYDMAFQYYKNYRDDYYKLIGAPVVHFANYNEKVIENQKLIAGLQFFDDKEDAFYIDNLKKSPRIDIHDVSVMGLSFEDDIVGERKQVGTSHNYPELVGTVDKYKFVLNKQAKDAGVFDNPNVQIFERDFLGYHIQMGLIAMQTVIRLIAELKYDGVSVEADICGDHIEGARSRGDTANDKGADLTSILKGYRFKHAHDIDPEYRFGIQFEAIMTYENLQVFNRLTGKDYKNCRTAISGLFNRIDGYKYKDLITLVPIRTSLHGIDRVAEIEFLNTYYHSGVYMKYAILEGSYVDILFQLKIFVDEASYMRDILEFMYDGVVVEYLNEELIEALGRVNSVNRFMGAIKFDPQCKQTKVTGLTFEVGKDGKITPMIHYLPVTFNGTIHDKSTLHSYARYLEEQPGLDKIIDVTYVNDVMPYATVPNNSYNDQITELIPYATECPCCHTPLVISDSGKNWYCTNILCPERNRRRISDFIHMLGVQDIAEETIDKLGIDSIRKLLSITLEDTKFLGDIAGQNIIDKIEYIKNTNFEEHKVVGGLGFTGLSDTKWKLVLEIYSLHEVYDMYKNNHLGCLRAIKGVGPKMVQTIEEELPFFEDDINIILNMKNVIPIKGQAKKIIVRFTNCRDKDMMDYLNSTGLYDADDKKGVTKITDILLIPYEGFTGPSGKYDNAIANGFTKIIPIDEFRKTIS